MIKIVKRTIKDRKAKTLKDFQIGSWIYVEDPTQKELDDLAKDRGLERDLLEDALDVNEVPRVEIEKDVTYVFTRVPHKNHDGIHTHPLLVGVAKDFVFTVSRKSLPFFSDFIDNKKESFTTQKVKIFSQIFGRIDQDYNRLVTDINKKVRASTSQVHKIKNEDIIQFVTFERILNDFMSALAPINALLNNIISGKYLKLHDEDKEFVEDLYLGNGQLIEVCKLNLKNIVNIRESYSTIVTNNLNRVIKLLTSLTVLLTVPTMIASFYGMNVALPYAQSPLAFIYILTGTFIVSLIILAIFIRNRWL